jgi:hypothetical protein
MKFDEMAPICKKYHNYSPLAAGDVIEFDSAVKFLAEFGTPV